MELLYNISALKRNIEDEPTFQKLSTYLDGATSQLTDFQKINLLEIIRKNYEEITEYIISNIEDKNLICQ